MWTLKRLLLLVLLIGVASSIGLFLYRKYRVAPEIPFSNLELQTLEGQPIALTEFQGKAIFLNFWATWCGDCRQEMPAIQKAMEQLQSKDIAFVFISDEAPEKVRKFQAEYKYPFIFLMSAKPHKSYGINAIPCTYLIDRKGQVVMTQVGGVDWSSPTNVQYIQNLTR